MKLCLIYDRKIELWVSVLNLFVVHTVEAAYIISVPLLHSPRER